MTSIDDVAASLGVSTATVSRALRGLPGVAEETRARVVSTARTLGYVPSSAASGLASGRTMAMGVLVPVINRWYFSAVLEGVDRQLRAAGYDLIVFSLGGDGINRDRVFHRSILRKRIDALLVMCMHLTEEERKAVQQLDYPNIVVGGAVEGVRHVGIDDAAAARDAVEHLISLGHTRIAHMRGGGSFDIDFEVPRIREQAYRDAMADHGLHVREDWSAFGDFRFSTSHASALQLLRDPSDRPTAVFCSSDEMAFGVLRAAVELGIDVPGELSVIGIDDHEFAEPMGLTTVRQDPEDQGAFAADILLGELLRDQPADYPPSRPHLLVERGTTGPVRA
ncbi:LacI family transcriptional regulator [Arthrobacter agilis]|uniref:LacI family DNA-binding transcriptional regulator n=1 Tax=Arthrobacter agilis TaxID=37921 RepID=UPI000B360005|nr:LacI family DNA-binding transcriptional regulator [Arthrobacter agilis]OUM43613.1 LacI family transcriptional regulator [Arthrobacter agilis]PPB46800.1 LacI family transcriptional regulator [Arthrobacter agilis]TPV24858.1 LacI family transcriptional regulator [Arthrobacter agilis]VDR31010.1 Catabolite control protein [Arthrobacter agilis]